MWIVVVLTLSIGAAACSSGDQPATQDRTGRDTTVGSESPGSQPTAAAGTLSLLSLNMLHGIPFPVGQCAESSAFCQADQRLTLLWRAIEEAGCPDVVSLQEFGPQQKETVPPRVGEVCDGRYRTVYEDSKLFDEQFLLTTLPVESSAITDLSGDFRTVTIVTMRLGDAPDARRLVLASTHTDDQADPCRAESCAAPVCAGESSLGVCQVRRTLDEIAKVAQPDDLVVVNGDLNQKPGTPGLRLIQESGFEDVWLASGNPECDPATGRGCTCCQEGGTRGAALGGLDDGSLQPSERIDYVLVRKPVGCAVRYDGPTDGDGDRTATGPFAHRPAPSPVSPGGPVWISDHSGVALDMTLQCA
jgi:endonuclease/exonuclease/phosphatase family metal-dependent hydrolase